MLLEPPHATTPTTQNLCALCGNSAQHYPITYESKTFCCHGCQSVFAILAAQGQLHHFDSHPIFLQAVRAGLISNPQVLESLKVKEAHANDVSLQKHHFEIADMWCPSCAEVIRLVCMQQKGIFSVFVDYATDLASVTFDPKMISNDAVFKLIKSLGYAPKNFEESLGTAPERQHYFRFVISAFFSSNAMMFAYPLYATYFTDDPEGYGLLFAWFSCISSIPVLTYCAYPIFRRCFSALSVGFFGMEALVFLGSFVAVIYSLYQLLQGNTDVYFDSASVIITFVLLGKIIESKGKFSAKKSLLRLSRSLPKRVRKITQGAYVFCPAKDLLKGDLIEVRMGEMVPIDGIVLEGIGICNESVMTGEAIPVSKSSGDAVVSGSHLQQGSLTINVTATSKESLLQRILDMIEKNIGAKSPYLRRIDTIVQWFVPLTLAIALLSACVALAIGLTYEEALFRALTVLIISCPCAIGIAVPLVESYMINHMAEMGVVVRNRGCLQYLGKESVIAFDKTGTVTEGRFQLIGGVGDLPDVQQKILAALVDKSNHPIAQAIKNALHVQPMPSQHIEEVIGKGIYGSFDGEICCIGSKCFLESLECKFDNVPDFHDAILEHAHAVTTTVYFCYKTQSPTPIYLGDCIRKNVDSLLKELSPAKTMLISGDSERSVSRVAHACGFSSYIAEVTPLEKQQFVERLKNAGEIVCMIGDGINDSLALTTAHVGVSVSAATDISIQVSDLLLTTEDITIIGRLRVMAAKGQKIIRQNIFWAFFYNVIGMAMAFLGLLTPIFAAFAMVASSLFVLFNAKRVS